MRLHPPALSTLISFLLGAGWGIALIGALAAFFFFVRLGYLFALFVAIFATMPGLLIVVFLEYMLLKNDIFFQMKRQTKLLEEIRDHALKSPPSP